MTENLTIPEKELARELFERTGKDLEGMNAISRPSLTYWQDAWIRLKKNKVAMVCLGILSLYIILAIVGPYMVPYDFKTNDAKAVNRIPDLKHWFGTDMLGRDLWSRVWTGARISLSIGIAATLINVCIGAVIGGISGYTGGRTDMVIMRIIDVMYGIPQLIFAILCMVVLGAGITSLIVAMIITGWLSTARLIRGQVLQLKNQEFVLAAKKLGASNYRIISRHLAPNFIGLIITNLTMQIPYNIFMEAFLTYIGIGIKPPIASWGVLVKMGAQNFRTFPHELLIPGFFICTTMLSLNLLGEGLRDALDPRLRGTSR
jgi:oligopeptide transport system permease protein